MPTPTLPIRREPTHGQARPTSRGRTWLYFIAGVAFVLLVVGSVRFARQLGGPIELRMAALTGHPATLHNLVAAKYGPSLRVSSAWIELESLHHPAFLVDEHLTPSLVEKWVSDRGDRAPYVELSWGHAKEIRSVVLRHAGVFEHVGFSTGRYTLTCFYRGRQVGKLAVDGPKSGESQHAPPCAAADTLRIDFRPDEGDVVRLYEVQVWGK